MLKKLGLTETDVYDLQSMAKFLPGPKVVKTKERGEYPAQPFHASRNIDRQAMGDLLLRSKVNAALGIGYQMPVS